jgi:hypothetical protein
VMNAKMSTCATGWRRCSSNSPVDSDRAGMPGGVLTKAERRGRGEQERKEARKRGK